MTEFAEVTCPTCGETFAVPPPDPPEVPCEWDYDCEVCCTPMTIMFATDGEGIIAEARGLGE